MHETGFLGHRGTIRPEQTKIDNYVWAKTRENRQMKISVRCIIKLKIASLKMWSLLPTGMRLYVNAQLRRPHVGNAQNTIQAFLGLIVPSEHEEQQQQVDQMGPHHSTIPVCHCSQAWLGQYVPMLTDWAAKLGRKKMPIQDEGSMIKGTTSRQKKEKGVLEEPSSNYYD